MAGSTTPQDTKSLTPARPEASKVSSHSLTLPLRVLTPSALMMLVLMLMPMLMLMLVPAQLRLLEARLYALR